MKKYLVITFLFIGFSSVFAQQKWTLRQCVDHAMKNSIQVRQKILETQSAKIQLNTIEMSRLPDLNAGMNQNFDFGRSTARDGVIKDANSANTGFSLNTSMPIFTGFRITNQIEANRLNLKAVLADLDKAREDIALYITSAYLQAIYNRELTKVAKDQASLSREQAQRAEILVKAGSLAESELYETRATLARDESEVTRTNSQLQLSLVDLAQLLELDKVSGFDIENPAVDSLMVSNIANLADVEQTFAVASLSRPSLKAAEFRLEEGRRNLEVARSAYYPTLTFGASYTNGYYHTYNPPVGFPNLSLADQWNLNGRNAIGLTLSIPIFNRYETRNRLKLSQIDIDARKLNFENTRKTLLKEVQQAYYNALAAKDKYNAAQKSVEASEVAFRFTQDKYKAGKSTSFEFNESSNRRLKSLSEQVQAKYDFIFRCKILDFYNGKPLF